MPRSVEFCNAHLIATLTLRVFKGLRVIPGKAFQFATIDRAPSLEFTGFIYD